MQGGHGLQLPARRSGDESQQRRDAGPGACVLGGVDAIWGMYAWLARAPKGRNEPSL